MFPEKKHFAINMQSDAELQHLNVHVLCRRSLLFLLYYVYKNIYADRHM